MSKGRQKHLAIQPYRSMCPIGGSAEDPAKLWAAISGRTYKKEKHPGLEY